MDVYCSTCGEPWDTYHLCCDEIFETSISFEEAQAWRELPYAEHLSVHYREIFRAAGWEFGQTIINVIRCPACPKTLNPTRTRWPSKPPLRKYSATTKTASPRPSKTTIYKRRKR